MKVELANEKFDSNSGKLRYFEYQIRLAPYQIAKIECCFRGEKDIYLSWLHVPPAFRKLGIGLKLLNLVVKMADSERIRLRLQAVACGGMDQKALERFYRSFGFVKRLHGSDIMVRRPRIRQLARRLSRVA